MSDNISAEAALSCNHGNLEAVRIKEETQYECGDENCPAVGICKAEEGYTKIKRQDGRNVLDERHQGQEEVFWAEFMRLCGELEEEGLSDTGDGDNPNRREDSSLSRRSDELKALRSLAMVLPDVNIDWSNLPEAQLKIVKGAIDYIHQLGAILDVEDKCNVTRAEMSTQPLIGIAGDPEPKRLQNGFIRFSVRKRREVALENPGVNNREISRLLGTKWKQMTTEEKKPYQEEFLEEKHRKRGGRKTLNGLVEPMPSRLRPRDQLKSKVKISSLKRPYKKRRHGHPFFKWAQCDDCQKWRRLPSGTDVKSLPQQWYCEYNQDPVYNHCSDPEDVWMPEIPSNTRLPNLSEADLIHSGVTETSEAPGGASGGENTETTLLSQDEALVISGLKDACSAPEEPSTCLTGTPVIRPSSHTTPPPNYSHCWAPISLSSFSHFNLYRPSRLYRGENTAQACFGTALSVEQFRINMGQTPFGGKPEC